MNQNERNKLQGIIEEVKSLKEEAPAVARYVSGKSNGSLRSRLNNVLVGLTELSGGKDGE